MRGLLTIFAAITVTAISMEWVQAQAPLDIRWLSFILDNNQPVPIRINPNTGLPDPINGVTVDSRFPSVSADGTRAVFQVGNEEMAQIWEAVYAPNQWSSSPVLNPNTNQPLLGVHPVISADGNYIAFASQQDYGFGTNNKQQVYVLDRIQNRIVPISFLWTDTDNDSVRDTYQPANGNCLPVYVGSNGRTVVFMAELPDAQNIVDADGDGVSDQLTNPPSSGWLVLIHDRDTDGNGVYDEAGIGATRTLVGSYDWDNATNQPIIASSISVNASANGRFIAFTVPMPFDPNNPNDPNRERWTVVLRDWQILSPNPQSPAGVGILQRIDDAFAPTLGNDGTYVAFLAPVQMDNDGDGQVNEDLIDGIDNDSDNLTDEDPYEPYPQTQMDLVVRQLIDPATGQPPAQLRELRLSALLSTLQQSAPQPGAANGTSGWGYSDWWGAVTLAVDPTNPNIVYVAFHAWATDLIDFQLVRNDLTIDTNNQTPRLQFYQGVPNIFLARFDFASNAQNPVQIWRLNTWASQQRGLPVSLEQSQQGYRLTLAPNLMPALSFINGGQLRIVFQSLSPFVQPDTNGIWDIYLATVTLP